MKRIFLATLIATLVVGPVAFAADPPSAPSQPPKSVEGPDIRRTEGALQRLSGMDGASGHYNPDLPWRSDPEGVDVR